VPDEQRARLFVALELPEDVRDALASWRSAAVPAIDGLRAIAADDLHVTLCFLGWQAAGSIPAIIDAYAAAVSGEPTDLELDRAIWLPPRRPRVLAVELVDSDGSLATLQAALSGALEQGGWYRPEKRAFRPHVTLARLRRGARAGRGDLAAPPHLRFRGGPTTVFRSRLSPSGARYEPLFRT
jgi:2'-5' RNA ligase